MSKRARIDQIRTLGFAGISGVYAAVGSAFTVRPRLMCINNNTDGDLYFTDDITQDKLFVAAGSFKLLDITSNMETHNDDAFEFPVGTQMYVKEITNPTSGDVYIELIYGYG